MGVKVQWGSGQLQRCSRQKSSAAEVDELSVVGLLCAGATPSAEFHTLRLSSVSCPARYCVG